MDAITSSMNSQIIAQMLLNQQIDAQLDAAAQNNGQATSTSSGKA